MKLSRLKPSGIALFGEYLDLLTNESTRVPPKELLDSTDHSELVAAVEVTPASPPTRLEMSSLIDQLVVSSGLSEVERDVGLWVWLTLFYFDVLCPATAGGERNPRERAAYIPEPNNFQRYYRHLLLGSYLIHRANKDDLSRAMAFLCKPPHVIDDVVAQIAARQEYITNRSVVELTTRLYFDAATGKLRRGAGGKGKGSPRRLADVLGQYDVTWDLYSMTTAEFLGVLPDEFARFR